MMESSVSHADMLILWKNVINVHKNHSYFSPNNKNVSYVFWQQSSNALSITVQVLGMRKERVNLQNSCNLK